MAECESCHAWQHGTCMGYQSPETMPLHYFCEKCRPDLYVELLKYASFFPLACAIGYMSGSRRKHAKRVRQSSANSHHAANRSSRSHSPTYLLKQPAKRRNTMNSRDAAYDESLQAILEATAAEAAASAAAEEAAAAAAAAATSPPAASLKSEQSVNGHPAEQEPEPEVVVGGRRKRKRTDDDA